VERKQGTKALFVRTTCKCPDRDYTVSDSCNEAGAAASLSNCVRAWIYQAPEINFQDLSNVQLGYVRSTGADIDFQGKIKKSLFCRIDAYEDVEFGGEECPADIRNNVFFNTIMRTKDFQFEEGTTVTENIFMNVKSGDDFEIKDGGAVGPTTITNNLFGDIEIADDCKVEAGAGAGLTISTNNCNTFTHPIGSECNNPPFSTGFSCLPS